MHGAESFVKSTMRQLVKKFPTFYITLLSFEELPTTLPYQNVLVCALCSAYRTTQVTCLVRADILI